MFFPIEIINSIHSFINPKFLSIDQRLVLKLDPLPICRISSYKIMLSYIFNDIFKIHWTFRRFSEFNNIFFDFKQKPRLLKCCKTNYSVVIHIRDSATNYRFKTMILDFDIYGNFLSELTFGYYVSTFTILNSSNFDHCFACFVKDF